MRSYFDKLTIEDNFESCCKSFYQDNMVRFFLGDSYHPGGIELTLDFVKLMGITKNSRILDVACGIGSSALTIAKKFGCQVVGIDMNTESIAIARERASTLGLEENVEFKIAKAGNTEFEKSSFTHILCECSFCLFNDKSKVALWFNELLTPNGILGISDIAVEREMPHDLSKMVYRVACISHAMSQKDFVLLFEKHGFNQLEMLDRKDTILDLHRKLKKKLIGLKLLKTFRSEINGIDISDIDLDEIKQVISQVKQFVEKGYGTYFLYTAKKL